MRRPLRAVALDMDIVRSDVDVGVNDPGVFVAVMLDTLPKRVWMAKFLDRQRDNRFSPPSKAEPIAVQTSSREKLGRSCARHVLRKMTLVRNTR